MVWGKGARSAPAGVGSETPDGSDFAPLGNAQMRSAEAGSDPQRGKEQDRVIGGQVEMNFSTQS